MGITQAQEKAAVDSGYWHLYRYNPLLEKRRKNLSYSIQRALTGVNSRISCTRKSVILRLSKHSCLKQKCSSRLLKEKCKMEV
jgi:pyruvate/2-oxoacid:ferredoxin oxidoreductase beta subunit